MSKAVKESTPTGAPPMLAGDPKEPTGPEDALGAGPKRGDYKDVMRLEAPHEARPNPEYDADDPESPKSVLVEQAPRVADVGEAPGKGGVSTEAAKKDDEKYQL